ncbi:MAG: tRNA (N(6)-L-threonylcarbamoyladenosine(37)-C(2))-methylthiotransferase MtaB [Alphaproteobacteria bacterium]
MTAPSTTQKQKDDTADGPELVTFGCRLNAYESEVMRGHAEAAGMDNAIIFNTCAVTSEAERQARQAIRRARRNNPDARIIVTGCAAQIDPDRFAGMGEVDEVIGNDLKLQPEAWGAPPAEKVRVNDIMAVKETAGHLVGGFDQHTRAFLQVQNGCDHRCTFCIIPYGRGNSRSVPIGEIVAQSRALLEDGVKEIVLTGVDITSYGPDLPGQPTLGQMIRRLLAQLPDLTRLRLSSLDPVEMDEDLWRLIETDDRLLPHLHLSMQAGHDMVLKRMKRRHLVDDIRAVVARARAARPDMAFGADIIAGFPTETEDMARATEDLVADLGLPFLHIFPYSARPGTPAARMPQVNGKDVKARAARLRQIGETNQSAFLRSLVGKRTTILTEKDGTGRTEHFARVSTPNHTAGDVFEAVIIGMEGDLLQI